jgi:hypothetical protein
MNVQLTENSKLKPSPKFPAAVLFVSVQLAESSTAKASRLLREVLLVSVQLAESWMRIALPNLLPSIAQLQTEPCNTLLKYIP